MAETEVEGVIRKDTSEAYFDRVADPSESMTHPGSKFLYKPASAEASKIFIQESERLAPILGKDAIIAHFGSTAVPELGGKGVIDIYAAVDREEMVRASRALSETAGYTLDTTGSDVKQARLFHTTQRTIEGRVNHVHTHLTYKDEEGIPSPNFVQSVAFRDFLIEHPDHTAKYDAAKREASRAAMDLVAAGEEGEARKVYMQTKAPVVREIIEDMGKSGYLDEWVKKHFPKKDK